MKLRHYFLLRGCLSAAMALFFAALPFFAKTDTFGFYFGIGFSILCAVVAYVCFRRARRVRDEERAFAPPVDATVAQKQSFYRRFLIVSLVVFPILTITTALDLNSLESGKQKRVSLWGPVALLYRSAGYWPAVLAIPGLGIAACASFYSKSRKTQG